MTDAFKNVLTSVVSPLLRRPKRFQVGALCYRIVEGQKQVLLITSRDTGRWVVPKGWPIDGLDAAGAALQEAWEEAGVSKANINRAPLGSFDYDKRLDDGTPIPVEAQVYALEVHQLKESFPEVDERTRKWVAADAAADMVNEPGLRTILRDFARSS